MMNLREIQASWNTLVPLAQARGIKAKHWAVPPQTVDRGMRRLNWLRGRLGIVVPENQQPELAHSLGASLPPIRDIVAQYNALIPEAQERGIRNARLWTGIPSTSLRGMQRLQWLRRQLGQTTAQTAPEIVLEPVDPAHEFDALTWGVEIEAMLPRGYGRNVLAADITAAGVPCQVEALSHATPTSWKIVTDGSLGRDYTRGIEIVSPVLTKQEGFLQLQKICAVLKTKKIRVTRKCGLHVHVGWKTGLLKWKARGLANLVQTYTHFEGVLDSHMAPSRRGSANHFCGSNTYHINKERLNRATTTSQVIEAIGQSSVTWRHSARYRKLNLQPLNKHGTIEFRQHHGTIDYENINNWIRFCLRLVIVSDAGITTDAETPKTPAALFTVLRMPEKEAQHFQSRINYFARVDNRTNRRAA